MRSPSPIPSIQTSFAIAVLRGRPDAAGLVHAVGTQVNSAPEKPVRAAPAIAGGTTRKEYGADRHLAYGEHLDEVGCPHGLEHGERRRHTMDADRLLLVAVPLSPARVADVGASGQTGAGYTVLSELPERESR